MAWRLFEVEDLAAALLLEVGWAAHVSSSASASSYRARGVALSSWAQGCVTGRGTRQVAHVPGPHVVGVRHFRGVVERGVELVTKPEEMAVLQASLGAALKSAAEGRMVRVSEVL